MAKYWIANNPNSEVTSAEAQKIKDLATAYQIYTTELFGNKKSQTNLTNKSKIEEIL